MSVPRNTDLPVHSYGSGAHYGELPLEALPAGDATGDIFYFSGSNWITVPITDVAGSGSGAGMVNPMTDVGDMIVGDTGGSPTALPIGLSSQYLAVVSGVPTWSYLDGVLPWVNVLDYGADPTGTDDSLAAFDLAIASRTERSAALIVPPGVYRMTGPLVLGNSTVILGVGANMEEQDPGGGGTLLTYRPHSVLYFDNDTDGIIAPDDAAVTYRCHHPVVQSIVIRGGGAAQGNRGVWLRDNASSSVSIQRVGLAEFRDCYLEYWGTAYDFDGTADSCKVVGGHVHDCDKGFVGGLSEDVFERVCVWNLVTGPAVSISGDRGQVIGCEIEPLVGSGIVLTSTAEFNRIVANDVKDVTGTAIDVAGNNNVIVGNTGSRSVSDYYNDTGTGNEWGHNTPTASFPAPTGGVSDFDDLADVIITTPATGEMPRWNGSTWVNDSGLICVDPGAITVDAGDPFGVTLTSVWGIDADDGQPYHDDAGATAGEEAALFYDPLNDYYTLITYDF